MSLIVKIGSNNYNGESATITFYPDTGGTISVGTYNLPYFFNSDYVYGKYILYFQDFDYSCDFNILQGQTLPVYVPPTIGEKTYNYGPPYIQDPEVMPENVLENSTYSGLTTNILLEPNFAGTFDGAISQFRMYSEPLNYPEIIHNFEILKNKFNLFDYRCPDCNDDLVNDITSSVSDSGFISFSSNTFSALTYTLYFIPENEINRITISEETSTPTFPTSYDITQPPILPFLGAGDYYFYFDSIEQTLKVNNPTNYFGDVVLLGGDIYLVDGNGDYIII